MDEMLKTRSIKNSQEVAAKISWLRAAAKNGKEFLLIQSEPKRLAIDWLLASFSTPLVATFVPPGLPEIALQKLISCLPTNKMVFAEQYLSSNNEIHEEKNLSSPWIIVFSSGSSGDPKAIVISGAALKASALAHGKHLGFHGWLADLPMHHIGGLSIVTRSYFLDTDIAIPLSPSPSETIEWIASGRIGGISLVPTTLGRLLRVSADPQVYKNLSLALVGGSPLNEELYQRAVAAGLPLRRTYGLSENTSQAATEIDSGSGLLPLPGVQIQVMKEGEILLRSPFLASGYWENGAFRPLPLNSEGYFSTGDLGKIGEESAALSILGRKSDLIISGGVNIFPSEIERACADLEGISEMAVVGLPDPEWGESVCFAYVGPHISPDSVKSHLRLRLPRAKIPKNYVQLPKLPRSAMGKILRKELQEHLIQILKSRSIN